MKTPKTSRDLFDEASWNDFAEFLSSVRSNPELEDDVFYEPAFAEGKRRRLRELLLDRASDQKYKAPLEDALAFLSNVRWHSLGAGEADKGWPEKDQKITRKNFTSLLSSAAKDHRNFLVCGVTGDISLQANEFFGLNRTSFWRTNFAGSRTLENFLQYQREAYEEKNSLVHLGHIEWAENLIGEPSNELDALRLQLYFRLANAENDKDTINAVCDYLALTLRKIRHFRLNRVNFLKFQNETWDSAIASYWLNIVSQIDSSQLSTRGMSWLPKRVTRWSHLRDWVGNNCGLLFGQAWDVLGDTKSVTRTDLLNSAEEWKALDIRIRNQMHDSRTLMLKEYRELATLTIPWGALFEIEICNFSHLRVYEMWDGLKAIWFTKDGKHHVQTMIGDQLNSELSRSFEADIQNLESTESDESDRLRHLDTIETLLSSLAATAIRDLVVVENKTYFPAVQPSKNKKIVERPGAGPIVVYLPRKRYTRADVLLGLSRIGETYERSSRAAHQRASHFRRLPEGSNATMFQKKLAESHGIAIPDGQTWIRESEITGLKRPKIYKSRSMLELYVGVSLLTSEKWDKLHSLSWREFEIFCQDWLKKDGCAIVKRNQMGGGDGGIDILATRDDSLVVAQAKHYTRPVPVNFVRELIGTKQVTRAEEAILMVSGVASPEAHELAKQNGVRILEGKDLVH